MVPEGQHNMSTPPAIRHESNPRFASLSPCQPQSGADVGLGDLPVVSTPTLSAGFGERRADSIPENPRKLKRKAGSSNLVFRRQREGHALSSSLSASVACAPESKTHYQQEFLSHPHHFPSINTPAHRSLAHLPNELVFRFPPAPPPRTARVIEQPQRGPHPISTGSPKPRIRPLSSARSDPSTTSLSHFPLPPKLCTATPPSSGQSKTEETKPTIYHIRGASFEFLNPRQSLCIHKIETPAEHDNDDSPDYFNFATKDTMTDGDDVAAKEPAPAQSSQQPGHDSDQLIARSTPPRSLFDDLPTAYSSITSRSCNKTVPLSPRLQDFPLPPTPIPTRISAQGGFTSTDINRRMPDHVNEHFHDLDAGVVSADSGSFKKRLSALLRRDGVKIPLSSTLISSSSVQSAEAQALGAQWSDTTIREMETLNKGCVVPKRDERDQLEKSDSLHYYNNPSFFRFDSVDQTSTSMRSKMFSDPQESESRIQNESKDASKDSLIASYGQFGGGDNTFSSTRLLSRRSLPLLPAELARPNQNATDSTIGEILDQYHRRDEPTTLQYGAFVKGLDDTRNLTVEGFNRTHPQMSQAPSHIKDFETGFLKPAWASHARAKSANNANQDVRSATWLALRRGSNFAPSVPLPVTPSTSLPRAGSLAPEDLSRTLSAESYGNTRQLLLLSDPSVEVRPVRELNTHNAGNHETDTAFHPPSDSYGNSLFIPNFNGRISSTDMDEMLDTDLRYLSGLSGLSEMSGSVFLVDESNSHYPQEQEQHQSLQFMFAEGIKAHPDDVKLTPVPTRQANTIPVAAFSRAAVNPGSFRQTGIERPSLEHVPQGYVSSHSPTPTSSDDGATGSTDEHEWETIAESRRTLGSQIVRDENFADYPSWNTFNSLGVHPGDGNYQYSYRLHSPTGSDGPILLPAYNYEGVPSFPNCNALTPPSPALYTSYRHPISLSPVHDNPFTSSPPQITGPPTERGRSSPRHVIENNAAESSNHAVYQFRGPNLSVIQEQTEHGLTSELRFDRIHDHGAANSSTSSVVLSIDVSSGQLGSEPGPTISIEADQGSPQDWQKSMKRPKSKILNSGADAALLQTLRDGDPRVGSSPLSMTNSFNKLSYLGPKANITGTPNGTGMREAGSSLVGSTPIGSSPRK